MLPYGQGKEVRKMYYYNDQKEARVGVALSRACYQSLRQEDRVVVYQGQGKGRIALVAYLQGEKVRI